LIESDILTTPLDSSSCQLVLILNNTLGNLVGRTFAEAEGQRRKALIEAHRLLADEGHLVLTVYHAPRMKRDSAYGDVFELDEELSDFASRDFVVRYRRTSTPCYSHWFEEDEVRDLLTNCGFEVEMIEMRLERLVITCRRKAEVAE
jgi:hypothetical protein